MADTMDTPGIEERYQTASNTSNLIAIGGDADRGGAVNVIIAAGWSSTRVGMSLLRLHSEFDASEKPTKPTREAVEVLIGTFQRAIPGEPVPPGKPMRLSAPQAVQHASAWYMHEMGLLLGKMKALPEVREQVTSQAMRWGMGKSDDPVTRSDITQSREQDAAAIRKLHDELAACEDPEEKAEREVHLKRANATVQARRLAEWRAEQVRATEKASGVIRYWLAQNCTACHGLRWQMVPGAPSLSNRICKVCGGGGVGQVPHGQEGRRLANWMDSCVEDARGILRRNLSARRTASNKA